MPADDPPAGIHAYALLSDCRGAALVSREASVDWCCLPRFDHGSCFAALLDEERGGSCSISAADGPLSATAQRYEPDTLILATDLAGAGGSVRVRDALVPEREPPRLIRVIECIDGGVDVVVRIAPRFDYGSVRPWLRMQDEHTATVIGGDDALLVRTDGTLSRASDHELVVRAPLRAGERLQLTLALQTPTGASGSAPAEDAASAVQDAEETERWWRDIAAGYGPIALRDPAVLRSALVLRALVYEPTGALVAAPTTSLPESPDGHRGWDYRYSWVRDATFAARALAKLGAPEVADRLSAFIMRSAAGHADELQVVYGVGGERRLPEQELHHLRGPLAARPVRIGNGAESQVQRDEGGEILQQCWHRHRRGHRFDADEWRFVRRVVDHVAAHWRRPDRGFWEWRGEPRHFLESKASCASALWCGIQIATEQGQEADVTRWEDERAQAGALVLDEGFDAAQGSFVQALGHPQLDATALLLPHSGVVAWADPRMVSTADVLAQRLGEDGLLRRYEGDDGLPGREGCFLACSFWLAECLAHQRRGPEAAAIFDRTLRTASPLGLFSEEHDAVSGRPLGNYPQALTHLAHVNAALAIADLQSSGAPM